MLPHYQFVPDFNGDEKTMRIRASNECHFFISTSFQLSINRCMDDLLQCNSGQNGSRTGGQNQMSHKLLITKVIRAPDNQKTKHFYFFLQIQAEADLSIQYQPAPASTSLLRPVSAWICNKIKNVLSSGYQDLKGYLILTTSP